MIIAIEIENLKCFAERQRIELAPIALLYGVNNSGKSTVMYALLLFNGQRPRRLSSACIKGEDRFTTKRITNERLIAGPVIGVLKSRSIANSNTVAIAIQSIVDGR